MAKVKHNPPVPQEEGWVRGDLLVLNDKYKSTAEEPDKVVMFLSYIQRGNFEGVQLQNGDLDDSWSVECFKKAPKDYTFTLGN